MRVVFIAPHDSSGALNWLTRALRHQGIADARLVALREPDPREGPSDIARVHDGGQELTDVLQNADVVHLVDLVPSEVPLLEAGLANRSRPPRLVLQRDTPATAGEAAAVQSVADRTGAKIVVTRPGLLARRDAFVPPFIPFGVSPWLPLLPGTRARSRAGVTHIVASGDRPLRQAPSLETMVDEVEALTAGQPQRRLEVLCGRPHRWALQRQRRAHLMLADGAGDLPREAIEALCQGVPVVCHLDPSAVAAYAELAPPAPVLDPARLTEIVDRLDPDAEPDGDLIAWAKGLASPRRWLQACARWYQPSPVKLVVAARPGAQDEPAGTSSSSSNARHPSRMIS